MIYVICSLLIVLFGSSNIHADKIEETAKRLLPASDKKLFITKEEEIQKTVQLAVAQRLEVKKTETEFSQEVFRESENAKAKIISIELALKRDPENEILKQSLDLAVQLYHIWSDMPHLRELLANAFDEQIKEGNAYFLLPQFKREYAEKKGVASFEGLLILYEEKAYFEQTQNHLKEQESNAYAELENRKRTAEANLELLKKEEKDRQTVREQDNRYANLLQFNEQLQLKDKLYKSRVMFDELKLREIEAKIAFIKIKQLTTKEKLDVVQKLIVQLKPTIKISEAEVALARDELDKKKQQSFMAKSEYRRELDVLSHEQRLKERELETLSKRYNIPLGGDLDEWSRDPKLTAGGYITYIQVATLNEQLLLLKRKKELIEAQNSLEDEKIRYEEVRIAAEETFYKVATGKFISEEDVTKERKRYTTFNAETKANQALFKERQNTLVLLLNLQKKALENIKDKKAFVEAERLGVFRNHQAEYEQCLILLREAEAKAGQLIDTVAKITGVYTDITATMLGTSKHIEFSVSELESITVWHRPEHAISWIGIENSIGDIQAFVKDVRHYVLNINPKKVMEQLFNYVPTPFYFFLLFLKLLALLIILFVLRRYLPHVPRRLLHIKHVPPLAHFIICVAALGLGFIAHYIISIFIWVVAFVVLINAERLDPYVYVLFYLISIPYLLYLCNRFIVYLEHFNKTHSYILLNKEYQRRFIFVFSTLLYATIIIFFFREAFILGNYRKSELPTILLAANFIIVQIAVILLIVKEQILYLISTKSEFWAWVHEQVDTFYYFFLILLIAVVVMSNPYVGFGKLLLYILKKLAFTFVVIQLLIWINEWFKRFTSSMFFYSDEELVRERFANAKTWYGLLVVAIFLVFTFLAILITARIWGWPDALIKITKWEDILAWVKTPLLEGMEPSISLYTIIKIIGFICGGALVSWAINRFILGRIFAILLVDAGVQNTIISILRYLIIITAIIIGFQSAGLGELVWYLLGALILGIGWVIKEPISDFISYFIILVQRPIKVGDYIWIDPNTMGVVRKITPRSVVVRRRNSNTLVIPNNQVVNKVVTNWNYSSGFIAFDDIVVTVTYKEDPAKVRELLLKVLDESNYVLKNPKPIVRLEDFNELGFVFLVRGFLSSNYTLDMWDIASDVRLAIVKKLRDDGIELAHPVRVMVGVNRPERAYDPDRRVEHN